MVLLWGTKQGDNKKTEMLWKHWWEYLVFLFMYFTLLQERGTFYLLFLKVYSRENQN